MFYSDPASPHLPASLHSWTRKAHSLHRRHVSNRPGPAPSIPEDIVHYPEKILDILSSDAPFDPDDAWDAYQYYHAFCEPNSSVTDSQLLDFANRILTTIQGELDSKTAPPLWPRWSIRIRSLLIDVDHRLDSPNSTHGHTPQHWHSLMARSYALSGSFTQALHHARQLVRHPRGADQDVYLSRLFETYETICLAMKYHSQPAAVLDLLVEEWKTLGHSLLYSRTSPQYPAVHNRLGSFRDVVFRIISYIQVPSRVMREVAGRASPETLKLTAIVYMEIMCRNDMGVDAFRVLQEMTHHKVQVPLRLKLYIVKALIKSNSYESANNLYLSVASEPTSDSDRRHYLISGLHLYAHQGLVELAQDAFTQLQKEGGVDIKVLGTLLHLYGVRGDSENAVKTFEEYFSEGSPHVPGIHHFTAVIFAHSTRGDYDGMNAWLEKMVQAGISPDKHVYNIILTSLADRGDFQAMKNVLDQMRSAGYKPDRVEYTTLISRLGFVKDPAAADLVYARALKEGVIPDRLMMSALMDAHVEAGSWQGVITAFDFIRQSETKGIRMSIEVYNTLLKAYVLSGSPFHVVSKLFQRLEEVDVQPDVYTFSLLIQSACDAGFMKTAMDLFMEMEKMSKHWKTTIHVNVYVLTIIMAGYLRLKDKVRARAVLDDMVQRGIDPTSVTYGLIIRAYGNEKTNKSVAIAEEFISFYLETEEKRRSGENGIPRSDALNSIYAPLMTAYAHRQKPEEVERLSQQMVEAGGESTLGTLTTLLDAHRRLGNIEAVKRGWTQIVELSKNIMTDVDPLFENDSIKPDPERVKNILAVPLSIYVDALSAAGQHLEIAKVWRELQTRGHTFDSHNWNHLTVALLRAGEPERAFEVIERVILPYRRQTFELVFRPEMPSSILVSDLPPPPDGRLTEPRPPSQSPLHSGERRSTTADLVARKARPWMTDTQSEDFALPLNVLYQVSPAWNIWRPHNITLRLLSRALAILQSGRVIASQDQRSSELFSSTVVDQKELEEQTALAGETLGRIYENYPMTVQAVKNYETWQLQRGRPGGTSRGGRRGKASGRGRGSRTTKYRRS